MFGTTPNISDAPASTTPFLPIFSGPEDPENCIGFIRANHEGRFEAFDTDKVSLDVFAASWPAAADAIWADCLGVPPRTNGGNPSTTVSEEPDIQPGPAQEPPMLAAALGLAKQRDWKLFPARMEDGKKWSWLAAKHAPGGENWGMTNDPQQLLHNFTNPKWQLKCGIGVPTGWVNQIFDIEADTLAGHGVDGLASLQELEAKHGKLPDTLMAISPSGSEHRIYRHPGPGIKVISRSLPGYPGVDIKGDGGMFVAPPSVRGDGVYRWLNDSPIAEAPQWLIGLVTAKSGTNGKGEPPPRPEIADAFKHLHARDMAEGIEYPTADIEEIRSAANAIPPSAITDESDWMGFARALAWQAKRHPEHKEALWEILDTVSQRAPKYDEAKNRDRFERYIGEAGKHEKPITLATLFHLAREHGRQGDLWEQERRARQIAENIKIGADVTEPLLPQIMTLKEMHERLVFIGSTGGVADTVTGRVRKKEHAADEYAASKHTYMAGNTLKEVPALKLWTASKDRMTVEVLTWVPGAPQICQPPEGQGPAFNMWQGLSPMAYPEDWQERVKPFLEHVAFLVPIEEERERFLQWLAHIVRVPEVLPHTSYLMTTPTTGIGRNLLASILVRALRGFVAAGISLPELLDGSFTGRLSKKLLAIVDEAREGSGERRYQRATRLTSLLNEEHRHINPKYGHQSIEKNCCRWLMFSNHADAIPFDNSDRRVIVIANPTTRKPDAYYERLYGLLTDNAFIGSVRHWLETKDITSFRPGEHAPMNQAKLQVLNEMMSETERAVAEFKEDCTTELTSRDAIKDYVPRSGPLLTVNDMHLTHAIRRAGMINANRRIRAYKKYDNNNIAEKRLSVVIVRGEWSIEVVKKASVEKLLETMGLQDWLAIKPPK